VKCSLAKTEAVGPPPDLSAIFVKSSDEMDDEPLPDDRFPAVKSTALKRVGDAVGASPKKKKKKKKKKGGEDGP